MPRLRRVLAFGGVLSLLLLLASCYTYGTEPEFVRGPLSDQPDYIRRATVIRAEDFMAQYQQFRESVIFGQQSYRIALGVRLVVDIINQDITRSVYVGPDGKIDLPLVGTVNAAGKRLDELRDDLKERYAPYFKGDFQVSVNTDRPDYLPFSGRWNLGGRATVIIADQSLRGTVVDLEGDEGLAEVLFSRFGGVNDLGEKPEWKEVGVIREIYLNEGEEPETVVILCNLERLLFGGDTRQNVPIRHRDIVFVPRRRDTLLEELHDSLGYWSTMLSDVQTIRDIVKAMEKW
jgi:protein involved in polysaccharide export with SLBB domain